MYLKYLEYSNYRMALVAAGAEIIAYKEVGSYQGDWCAICDYKGKRIAVMGCYGSCSGCDAFQADFSYIELKYDNGKYLVDWSEVTKEEFEEKEPEYRRRLSEFAQSYLSTPFEKSDIDREISICAEWDADRKILLEWALTYLN